MSWRRLWPRSRGLWAVRMRRCVAFGGGCFIGVWDRVCFISTTYSMPNGLVDLSDSVSTFVPSPDEHSSHVADGSTATKRVWASRGEGDVHRFPTSGLSGSWAAGGTTRRGRPLWCVMPVVLWPIFISLSTGTWTRRANHGLLRPHCVLVAASEPRTGVLCRVPWLWRHG